MNALLALPAPLFTGIGLLMVAAVVGLVAWALQLMQAASERREFSLMLAGCGIKRGVVVGGTDPDGVHVDGQAFNEKNLFATIFTALGIDPYAAYDLGDLPSFHRVEDNAEPIKAVLA